LNFSSIFLFASFLSHHPSPSFSIS
jgi:hypothetical protein